MVATSVGGTVADDPYRNKSITITTTTVVVFVITVQEGLAGRAAASAKNTSPKWV